MTAKLFEAALGIAAPWSVSTVELPRGGQVADGAGGLQARYAVVLGRPRRSCRARPDRGL